LPAHPSWEQVHAEYETIWRTLDGRSIENLIDLPQMTNPELQAAIQLLSVVSSTAYFAHFRLCCLLMCRTVTVSMLHGMCSASAHAFGYFGTMLGPIFHRYSEGYQLAKLACDLVDKHGFVASRAKVYFYTAQAALWSQPIETAIDLFNAAFRTATETGDLTHACFCTDHRITYFLLRNDPLDAVWREAEKGLHFVRKARFQGVAAVIVSQQRFIATMQGRTSSFSTFSDAQFDEAASRRTSRGTATLRLFAYIGSLS
jgi:predicted ATPase